MFEHIDFAMHKYVLHTYLENWSISKKVSKHFFVWMKVMKKPKWQSVVPIWTNYQILTENSNSFIIVLWVFDPTY